MGASWIPDGRCREGAALGIASEREQPRATAELDFDQFSAGTEGYSGSDLVLVCKEAAMRPLRRLMATIEDVDVRRCRPLKLQPVKKPLGDPTDAGQRDEDRPTPSRKETTKMARKARGAAANI